MRVLDQTISQPSSLLILCQLFYPELVSTGQTMTEFAEQLVALGVEVEVLCGPPTILNRRKLIPKRMVHRGISIRRVWGTRFPKLNLVGRILNQLTFTCSTFLYLLLRRPKKPILVLTNPPFLAMGCALLRYLRLGAPYLYLVFDVYPDTAIRLGLLRQDGWLVRLWERLNRIAYRRASAVIVIGRCMRKVVETKLRQANSNTEKLHYIPIWCDDVAIRSTVSARSELAKKFDVENKFIVGYFGNMGRFHDMETIMEAAELLKAQRDIVFLFVGEGHKKQWAMEWVCQKDLQNCRFHGYVPREQLGELLSLADLGLVSLLEGQEGLSVPAKTFGLMAASVPVLAVVPAVSEIAQIVVETRCGQWVCPGNSEALAEAIRELERDSLKRKRLGSNGRKAIDSEYNLDNISRKYIELVRSISMLSQSSVSCGKKASKAHRVAVGSSGTPYPIIESRTANKTASYSMSSKQESNI